MALDPCSTLLRLLGLAAASIRRPVDGRISPEIAKKLFGLIAHDVPVQNWYFEVLAEPEAKADLWDLLCFLHPGVARADLDLEPRAGTVAGDLGLRPTVLLLLGNAAEEQAVRRASLPLDQGGKLVSLPAECERYGRPLPCQFIVAEYCSLQQLQLWHEGDHIHICLPGMSLTTFAASRRKEKKRRRGRAPQPHRGSCGI
jgi:hypothetical protein